jgi:hypothetical protein
MKNNASFRRAAYIITVTTLAVLFSTASILGIRVCSVSFILAGGPEGIPFRKIAVDILIYVILLLCSLGFTYLFHIWTKRSAHKEDHQNKGGKSSFASRILAISALLSLASFLFIKIPFVEMGGFSDIRYGLMFVFMPFLWRCILGLSIDLHVKRKLIILIACILAYTAIDAFRIHPSYIITHIDQISPDDRWMKYSYDKDTFLTSEYPRMRMPMQAALDFMSNPGKYREYDIDITMKNVTGLYLYEIMPTVDNRYDNMWLYGWVEEDTGPLFLMPYEDFSSTIVALVRVDEMSEAEIQSLLKSIGITIYYCPSTVTYENYDPFHDTYIPLKYVRVSTTNQ